MIRHSKWVNKMLRVMFSKSWLPLTIIAIIAIAGTIRLGIWQLDRLEQRRAFNSRVTAQLEQPELLLDDDVLGEDLHNMEYREVLVRGVYDHDQEIALRNQHWGNQWGVHLVTPLKINNSDFAVLVDRGWIPAEDFDSGDWSRFSEPGIVEVQGVIRRSKEKADFGSRSDPVPADGEQRLTAWNFVNIDSISKQVGYPLLPVYVQQAPDETWTVLPYRSEPDFEITEGPHMGYAIQWFTFAVITAVGYPILVQRRIKAKENSRSQAERISAEVVHDQTMAN